MQELGIPFGSWVPTLELTVQYFAVPAPGTKKRRKRAREKQKKKKGIERRKQTEEEHREKKTNRRRTKLIVAIRTRVRTQQMHGDSEWGGGDTRIAVGLATEPYCNQQTNGTLVFYECHQQQYQSLNMYRYLNDSLYFILLYFIFIYFVFLLCLISPFLL